MAIMRWPRRSSSETRRMARRGAPSLVLSLALFLSGCAGLGGGKESVPTAGPPPRSDQPAPLPGQGSLSVQKGRPGHVVGAPHGTTDSATDVIGLELARRTGFGSAVATGFGKLDAERSEEHTSELQSRENLVCRLLLEKKK